jgi:hypothetical protein
VGSRSWPEAPPPLLANAWPPATRSAPARDAREATTTRQYLERQAQDVARALAQAEGSLADFKRQVGPVLGGDPTLVASRVADLKQRAQEAQALTAEAASRAAGLRAALAERERQMALARPGPARARLYYTNLRQRYSEAAEPPAWRPAGTRRGPGPGPNA